MDFEPTNQQLLDAILNVQSAMVYGFTVLHRRITSLEARMASLETGAIRAESRFHEFDEDAQSFRIDVTRRFDRVEDRLL
jgi:hypothetical protein